LGDGNVDVFEYGQRLAGRLGEGFADLVMSNRIAETQADRLSAFVAAPAAAQCTILHKYKLCKVAAKELVGVLIPR
jgi:hypothetical protein